MGGGVFVQPSSAAAALLLLQPAHEPAAHRARLLRPRGARPLDAAQRLRRPGAPRLGGLLRRDLRLGGELERRAGASGEGAGVWWAVGT